MNLELLIFAGGILHFGILLASAMVPKVLDWKASLAKLDGLFRQLVWVHGAFIVLVIIGFGVLSVGKRPPAPFALDVCVLSAGGSAGLFAVGFVAALSGAILADRFGV